MALLAWLIMVVLLHSRIVESSTSDHEKRKIEEASHSASPHILSLLDKLAEKYPPPKTTEHILDLDGQIQQPDDTAQDKLHFSDKRGRLAVLSDDRRTATREYDSMGFALVYTSRPLKDDELFQIELQDKDDTTDFNLMQFGVTNKNPEEVVRVPDMAVYIPGTSWLLVSTGLVESNGTIWRSIYSKYSPRESRVGDKLGVMKKSNGDIHFYFNGEDLGAGKSGVLDEVYGVVDILSFSKKISIV